MNEPKSLRDLIELAALKRGASALRLAELADSAGHRITEAAITAIREGTGTAAPEASTIRAIAWLAGVSEEAAFAAAGQTAEHPVPKPADEDAVAPPPQWPDLAAYRGPTALSGGERPGDGPGEEPQDSSTG